MLKKGAPVLHPMLFAILPIIKIAGGRGLPLLLITSRAALLLGFTLGLILVLRPLLPCLPRRTVFVSFFLLLFFNYIPVYFLLMAVWPAGPTLLLNLAFIAGLIAVITLLTRAKSDFNIFTVFANVAGLVALTYALMPVLGTRGAAENVRKVDVARQIVQQNIAQPVQQAGAPPDIYYIILDGYARADTLQRLYQLDNSAFLTFLESHGFYVPRHSRSNYPQTYLSLASSLNWSYLDGLAAEMGQSSDDRSPLLYMIENSSAAALLAKDGYSVALLPPEYWTSPYGVNMDLASLGPFVLQPFDANLALNTPVSTWFAAQRYQSHGTRNLRTLDELTIKPIRGSPRFVYAHIVAPHPPFVFGAAGAQLVPTAPFAINDGNAYLGSHDEYVSGYRDQLIFITTRVEQLVDTILAQSTTPPVIILQADHGPGSMLAWEDPASTDMQERLCDLRRLLRA